MNMKNVKSNFYSVIKILNYSELYKMALTCVVFNLLNVIVYNLLKGENGISGFVSGMLVGAAAIMPLSALLIPLIAAAHSNLLFMSPVKSSCIAKAITAAIDIVYGGILLSDIIVYLLLGKTEKLLIDCIRLFIIYIIMTFIIYLFIQPNLSILKSYRISQFIIMFISMFIGIVITAACRLNFLDSHINILKISPKNSRSYITITIAAVLFVILLIVRYIIQNKIDSKIRLTKIYKNSKKNNIEESYI